MGTYMAPHSADPLKESTTEPAFRWYPQTIWDLFLKKFAIDAKRCGNFKSFLLSYLIALITLMLNGGKSK